MEHEPIKKNPPQEPSPLYPDIHLSSRRDILSKGGVLDNKERKPNSYQDGGAEIHPDLEGIIFEFWWEKDEEKQGCAVIVEVPEESIKSRSLANKLKNEVRTKVFEDFSEAKSWLRSRAEELAVGE